MLLLCVSVFVFVCDCTEWTFAGIFFFGHPTISYVCVSISHFRGVLMKFTGFPEDYVIGWLLKIIFTVHLSKGEIFIGYICAEKATFPIQFLLLLEILKSTRMVPSGLFKASTFSKYPDEHL